MKISIWKEFDGYQEKPHHHVYLDGEKVEDAIAAYEEIVFVIKYKKDENGNSVRAPGDEFRLKAEVLTGDIEIRTIKG